LTAAVRMGKNILIAGATSTGNTTLAGVLADAIPEQKCILIIEVTSELHIRKPHVESLESQADTHRGTITFDDLLKAILRHRPALLGKKQIIKRPRQHAITGTRPRSKE